MIKLTADEQAHVRTALRYLRRRAGGWKALAPALGFRKKTLTNVAEGRTVSPAVAFSVARLAGVSVDDLLAGRFPPSGTCPRCGYVTARPP
jgi:hypothetical protein